MNRGRIFTFYSYKGGVGRTMALANVAALMAQWSYRVLCVDWDLEAPGLDLYLPVVGSRQHTLGLVDLIAAFASDQEPSWRDYVSHCMLSSNMKVDVLHAGKDDELFLSRMHSVDWATLYEEKSLGDFIEHLRAEWTSAYDFILIDSRTGVTDAGGICTAQLPDELVVLFTANHQSFNGVLRVLDLAEQQRDRLPVDRSQPLVLPLISRFEIRVEYEEAHLWLDEFEYRLRDPLERWIAPEDIRDVLGLLRVPYIPYWSFGERLAVVERGTSDPDDLGFTYESIAALLINGLPGINELRTNREAFIGRAQAASRIRPATYDILIFGQSEDSAFIDELSAELKDHGVKVVQWTNLSSNDREMEFLLEASSNYLFVVGRTWNPLRTPLVEKVLEMQALSPEPRRVIPLMRTDGSTTEMPFALRRLVPLRENDNPVRSAEAIMALLELDKREEHSVEHLSQTVEIERMGWIELDDSLARAFTEYSEKLAAISSIIVALNERVSADALTLSGINARAQSAKQAAASGNREADREAKKLRHSLKGMFDRCGTLFRVTARRIGDHRKDADRLLSLIEDMLHAARSIGMGEDSAEALAQLNGQLDLSISSVATMRAAIDELPSMSADLRQGKNILLTEIEMLLKQFRSLQMIIQTHLGAVVHHS